MIIRERIAGNTIHQVEHSHAHFYNYARIIDGKLVDYRLSLPRDEALGLFRMKEG